jgi:hypothetical protein
MRQIVTRQEPLVKGLAPRSRPRHENARRLRPRAGLTLIELLLAVALAATLMLAVAMAVDIYLRLVDSRRTTVEEAQLSRAVLRRIADDIRGTLSFDPVDFSSVEELAGSGDAPPPSGDAAGGGGGGMGNGMGGGGEQGGSESEDRTEATETAAAAAPPVPGLYGSQYALEIDVSRVPRPDEYLFPPVGEAGSGSLGDVKTIAYYLRTDSAAAAAPLANPDMSPAGGGRGLVRRVLGRAVTHWAAENGGLADLERAGEVIAPEVTALEFRYFDGLTWLTTWDSDQLGGLPLAVEIVMAIQPAARRGAARGTSTSGTQPFSLAASGPNDMVFRFVVAIPAGTIAVKPEAPAETEVPVETTPPETGGPP